MMNILDKLKAGSTAIATVALAEDVSVGLRILNEQDYLQAQIDTYQALMGLDIEMNISSADAYDTESSSQLLVRAVVDVESGKPLFASAKLLRESLTREQKSVLIGEYLEHEKRYSPVAGRNMDDKAFGALLDSLKKTPASVNLNDLSFGTLKRLTLALASPLAS